MVAGRATTLRRNRPRHPREESGLGPTAARSRTPWTRVKAGLLWIIGIEGRHGLQSSLPFWQRQHWRPSWKFACIASHQPFCATPTASRNSNHYARANTDHRRQRTRRHSADRRAGPGRRALPRRPRARRTVGAGCLPQPRYEAVCCLLAGCGTGRRYQGQLGLLDRDPGQQPHQRDNGAGGQGQLEGPPSTARTAPSRRRLSTKCARSSTP